MSETSFAAVQEIENDNFKRALEDLPGQKWPDQAHYLEDGSVEYRPATKEYKLANPNTVVAPHRERFIDAISNNLAVVGRSPTGTGKTTELTIYAMESGQFDRIYVTQPRVVAARATTQYERSKLEPLVGEELAREAIGWHTAPDSDYDDTKNIIINVTDGIPVQQLISNDSMGGDRTLFIIDEIHEDKANMHILMMLAKKLNIHVLLLSATVDVDEKASYFADENGNPAPIIDIEGRTFPILERDYFAQPEKVNGRQPRPNGSVSLVKHKVQPKLAEGEAQEKKPVYRDVYSAAVDHAAQGRDVLIFVPDIKDIRRISARLRDRVPKSYTILGLHSEQTPEEQAAALGGYPGGKIVIATDIAMTSLTPNVDVVLDSGMSRTPELKNGVDGLTVIPSSRAARDQRRGRCGRTKPGMYELVRVPGYPVPIGYDELDDYDRSEILSKRPDELLMKLGKFGLDSCGDLIQPPDKNEVELAVRRLRRLGAIGLEGYSLTDIGEQMVGLPLDAHGSRMLVESYEYSRSVQRQMAAALMVRQVNGIHSQGMNVQYMQRFSKERDADMLVGLDLFIEAMKMTADERHANNIVEQKFQKALTAYEGLVEGRLGLHPYDLTSPTDVERAQLHACMISGVDQIFIAKSKGRYSDGVHKMRRKAQDSRIWTTPGELVAGVPYDIGRVSDRGYSTARTVTNAFRVDIDSLREFAPERIEDRKRTDKYRINKQGVVEEQYAVYFDGHPLNKYFWQEAESSRDAREFLVENILDEDFTGVDHLPSSIQQLRRELKDLRQLQHRTDVFLDIESKIAHMKEVIRQNMPLEATTLEDVQSFAINGHIPTVSDHTRQEILAQAPDTLTLFNEHTQEFVDVSVKYIDNTAYITLPKELYPLLAADIPQLNGRQVMVRPLSGHRYLDQAEAYEQRASRRDNRGTIVAPGEVRQRRAERFSDQNAPLPSSQIKAGIRRKQISYRRAGRSVQHGTSMTGERPDTSRA